MSKKKGWVADLSDKMPMKWTVTFENKRLKKELSDGGKISYFVLKCFEQPPFIRIFNVEHGGIGRILVSFAGIVHKDGLTFNFFISEVK